MRWKLAAATLLTVSAASGADAGPAPLYDPVILNIGFVCRWNAHCMDQQKGAMNRALKFVRKKDVQPQCRETRSEDRLDRFR